MDKRIVIEDGTSRAQLMKFIKKFEEKYSVTVLVFEVDKQHKYTLIESDGISITKWVGVVDDFISEPNVNKMRIVDFF